MLDCLRKQLTVHRSARGQERWRSHPAAPPVLWVLAAGRPKGALQALGMTPAPGMAPGRVHGRGGTAAAVGGDRGAACDPRHAAGALMGAGPGVARRHRGAQGPAGGCLGA